MAYHVRHVSNTDSSLTRSVICLAVSFFFLIRLYMMLACQTRDFSAITCGGIVKPLKSFFLIGFPSSPTKPLPCPTCERGRLYPRSKRLLDHYYPSTTSAPTLEWLLNKANPSSSAKWSLYPALSTPSPPSGSSEACARVKAMPHMCPISIFTDVRSASYATCPLAPHLCH